MMKTGPMKVFCWWVALSWAGPVCFSGSNQMNLVSSSTGNNIMPLLFVEAVRKKASPSLVDQMHGFRRFSGRGTSALDFDKWSQMTTQELPEEERETESGEEARGESENQPPASWSGWLQKQTFGPLELSLAGLVATEFALGAWANELGAFDDFKTRAAASWNSMPFWKKVKNEETFKSMLENMTTVAEETLDDVTNLPVPQAGKPFTGNQDADKMGELAAKMADLQAQAKKVADFFDWNPCSGPDAATCAKDEWFEKTEAGAAPHQALVKNAELLNAGLKIL
ncbi:unnamed protein product [Amoebophrya sp. A120]|nr:unnamed protein product [Amoebophrya sp. A120]|eukprot:GSA120T00014377001.1